MNFNIIEFIWLLEKDEPTFERLKSKESISFSNEQISAYLKDADGDFNSPQGSYLVEYEFVIIQSPFKRSKRIQKIWVEMTSEEGGLIQEVL